MKTKCYIFVILILLLLSIVPGCKSQAKIYQERLATFNSVLENKNLQLRKDEYQKCKEQGIQIPEEYLTKMDMSIYDLIENRPPCNITYVSRYKKGGRVYRETYKEIFNMELQPADEWFLSILHRTAELLDEGTLTPGQAKIVVAESRMFLAERQRIAQLQAASVYAQQQAASAAQIGAWASMSSALNQSLQKRGITCMRMGNIVNCY